jgi:predicted hydrolase (HD superfamily)
VIREPELLLRTVIPMGNPIYGREKAWNLLTEWTRSESLRKHAPAVESCVIACGERMATWACDASNYYLDAEA